MGCVNNKQSSPSSPSSSKSRRKTAAQEELLKILLLGVAGCGKSTTAKQFRITHPPPEDSQSTIWSTAELDNYKKIIHRNFYYELAKIIRELDIQSTETDVQQAVDYFSGLSIENPDPEKESSTTAFEHVKVIVNLSEVTNFLSNPSFPLPSFFPYYFSQIDRICSPDYIPSNQDIVFSRQRSIGLTRTRFKKDRFICELIDPGGQQMERKKWVRALEEDITAVLFIVAINEFDVLSEFDSNKTTLEEALEEWTDFINSDAANGRCIILFLNKADLFKEKISLLKSNFQDYKGGKDFDKAIEYIKEKFVNQVDDDRQKIYTHTTCAVDTEQIQVIFKSVFTSIFESRLKKLGM